MVVLLYTSTVYSMALASVSVKWSCAVLLASKISYNYINMYNIFVLAYSTTQASQHSQFTKVKNLMTVSYSLPLLNG